MRAFYAVAVSDESSSMLSKGLLREITFVFFFRMLAGTSAELVDAPIVAASVGADWRVPGGSMIRIFVTSNSSVRHRLGLGLTLEVTARKKAATMNP